MIDILILFLLIVIFIALVIYFTMRFKNMLFISYFNKPKWLPWAIAAVMTAVCIYLFHFFLTIYAVIIAFLLYSFIITDLLNLITNKLIKNDAIQKRWAWLYRSGFLVAVSMLVLISISYFTAINVVITNYNLHTNKSLGTPCIKVAMISDLHLGTTMNTDKLAQYCREINASKPDLVVLDGDIFDENTPGREMQIAARLLGNIKSTYGVYYVFGNHDINGYGINPSFSEQDIINNLTANGITILNDETKLVDNKFYIIGRKDASLSRKANRKPISGLLNGVDKSKFTFLLDHQPLELNEAAKEGIDLQLSGHTHGGQVWPVGLLNNVFHLVELNYGYKKIGNYQIIVSSGIGGWRFPLRLGSKAEIVLIQLHSNNTIN